MQEKVLQIVIKAKNEAEATLKKFNATLKDNKKSLDAVKTASGLAMGAISAFAVSSVRSAIQAEQAQAQLGAVLKSTGGIAGVTAEKAIELASSLQKVTTFGDEAIISAQSMLLTFTKIGSDIFPQVTETVLDMSTALGQDLQSSAIQLGKALNDPVQGITALRRVGVAFSDAQQKVIADLVATGKSAEAQRLILKELATEFGGSARAKAQTFGGQIEILKNQFDDLQEEIGKGIIVALRQSSGESAVTENSFKTLSESTKPLQIGFYTVTLAGIAFLQTLDLIGKNIAGVITAVGATKKIFSGDVEEGMAMFDSATQQVSDSSDRLKSTLSSLLNPAKSLENALSSFSPTFATLPKNINATENAIVGLTDEQKKSLEVVKKLGNEYSDFKDSVGKSLDSLKEKHQTSLSNIKSQISGLRDSLKSLNAEYQKQKGADVRSIAERLVQEEVDIATMRKQLASETSFEQIQAITNELKAKEQALQNSAGFQSTIQGAIDEARRRASLTEVERAIEDFNQRRAEAEAEYQARTSEINREIGQLKDQKKRETALYEEQRTKLKQILAEQKAHYTQSVLDRYTLTEEYLEKEMELYKKLQRQIERVLSLQSASGSGSSKKGRATGGGVQVGQSYMVGEKGPEMFTPSSNGSITPNYKMAGAGGINLTINMNGGTYLDDNVAEMIGDRLIQVFKRTARF